MAPVSVIDLTSSPEPEGERDRSSHWKSMVTLPRQQKISRHGPNRPDAAERVGKTSETPRRKVSNAPSIRGTLPDVPKEPVLPSYHGLPGPLGTWSAPYNPASLQQAHGGAARRTGFEAFPKAPPFRQNHPSASRSNYPERERESVRPMGLSRHAERERESVRPIGLSRHAERERESLKPFLRLPSSTPGGAKTRGPEPLPSVKTKPSTSSIEVVDLLSGDNDGPRSPRIPKRRRIALRERQQPADQHPAPNGLKLELSGDSGESLNQVLPIASNDIVPSLGDSEDSSAQNVKQPEDLHPDQDEASTALGARNGRLVVSSVAQDKSAAPGSNRRNIYSQEDNDLLFKLKGEQKMKWNEIAHRFPGGP